MELAFYIGAVVAVAATALAVTRLDAVHALLYLIVSLLAVALVFFSLGAPFVAALEVVIYAGAIMVLFIFVVMTLNLGERSTALESRWLKPGHWLGPALLAAALLAETGWLLFHGEARPPASASTVGPKQVALDLFGPYVLGVELASMLLLAGLVGAYHIGQRAHEVEREVRDVVGARAARAAAGGGPVRPGAGRTADAPQPDLHPHVH